MFTHNNRQNGPPIQHAGIHSIAAEPGATKQRKSTAAAQVAAKLTISFP